MTILEVLNICIRVALDLVALSFCALVIVGIIKLITLLVSIKWEEGNEDAD